MEIYVYYNFDCVSEKELDTVKKHFETREMNVETDGLHLFIESDETKKDYYEIESEKTHIEIAIKDWEEPARILNRDFTVEGTVDTSAVAGEYMDFRIEYKNGVFSAEYSDFYTECCMSDFEDYTEYREALSDPGIEPLTEEEFEAARDEDMYIIETQDGNKLSDDVPLVHKL